MSFYVYQEKVDKDRLQIFLEEIRNKSGFSVYEERVEKMGFTTHLDIDSPFYLLRVFSKEEEIQIRPNRFSFYNISIITKCRKSWSLVNSADFKQLHWRKQLTVYLHTREEPPYEKLFIDVLNKDNLGDFYKWSEVKLDER